MSRVNTSCHSIREFTCARNMHVSPDKVRVPVDKYLQHQKLFGLFVQGNGNINGQTRSDWNIFCTQSLKTDMPRKWQCLSEQLVQTQRQKGVQLSIARSSIPSPRFKCSFNVGLSLTLRALALHGVNQDIIHRTRDRLCEQQLSIDAKMPHTRHRHNTLSLENNKQSSRCLIWNLPRANVVNRRVSSILQRQSHIM